MPTWNKVTSKEKKWQHDRRNNEEKKRPKQKYTHKEKARVRARIKEVERMYPCILTTSYASKWGRWGKRTER
jgi:hypothetical protein